MVRYNTPRKTNPFSPNSLKSLFEMSLPFPQPALLFITSYCYLFASFSVCYDSNSVGHRVLGPHPLSNSGVDRMGSTTIRVLLDTRLCDESIRHETSGFRDTVGPEEE